MADPLKELMLSRAQKEQVAEHYREPRKLLDWQAAAPEVTAPPPPAWFLPDPAVVGSPFMARTAKRLLDIDPMVKQKVKRVVAGPVNGVIQDLFRAQIDPAKYEYTNLLGMFDRRNGDVSVNPRLSQYGTIQPETDMRHQLLETLVHELSHAAGHGESGARRGGLIADPEYKLQTSRETVLGR